MTGAVAVTQARVARAEWTKLVSLRSTLWSLLFAVGCLAGIGFLAALGQMNSWESLSAQDRAMYDGAETAVAGWRLAELAVGVLGVLTITGEYATGMIRSSLMAAPKRLPVLWAKVGVFAGMTLALMLVASFVAFFITQPVLTQHDVDRTLGDPHALRIVVGTALFLTMLGVLAVGLGALIRNSAGGIATFFALVLVLPPVVGLLPGGLADALGPYLPGSAGSALATAVPGSDSLSPWAGFAVLCGWAAAAVSAAAVGLLRRDA